MQQMKVARVYVGQFVVWKTHGPRELTAAASGQQPGNFDFDVSGLLEDPFSQFPTDPFVYVTCWKPCIGLMHALSVETCLLRFD